MSVTIGIYDLFAYTIPGFLYLFVINEFFRLIGWNSLQFDQLNQIPDLIFAAIAILCAYVIGNLFDFFAGWFLNTLLGRGRTPEVELTRLTKRYPTLDIRFVPKDWELLFALLRQRAREPSSLIETYGATGILHRNICFGLLLLAILQIYQMFLNYSHAGLAIAIGILILCYVAYRRNRMYYVWFFREIYEASLNYGKSIEEVVAYGKETQPSAPNKIRKVKSART